MTEVETKLFLVACAQTTLTDQGVFQGPSNHTLSRQGVRHAKLLSKHLKGDKIDSFYAPVSSLYVRQRYGSHLLAKVLEFTGES